jgi:hypothetical protein
MLVTEVLEELESGLFGFCEFAANSGHWLISCFRLSSSETVVLISSTSSDNHKIIYW